MSETYSVKILSWGEDTPWGVSYTQDSVATQSLPTGFVIHTDGLYYEGTYQPGQSRNVMPLVNKAIAAWLGVAR